MAIVYLWGALCANAHHQLNYVLTLDQLSVEFLDLILPSLDDPDLCRLATLCRSLHISSLNLLFSRNRTFRPLASSSVPKPSAGSPVKLLHSMPATAMCINLPNTRNSLVLLGLRLALALLFEDYSPIALFCSFSARFSILRGEVKGLSRFLAHSPISATIECIILDLGRTPTQVDWEPIPDVSFLLELLSLISSSTKGRSRLHRQTSLSILWNSVFDGEHQYLPPPTWLRGGGKVANVTQALVTTGSNCLHSISKSKRPPPPTVLGLYTLHLHSSFIFRPTFIDWTLSALTRSTSLRVLSFYNTQLSVYEWSTILARITLPNLEEIYFEHDYPASMDGLTNFLIRHPSIKVLDLGGCVIPSLSRSWKRPPFFLPNLTALKGSPSDLEHFLHPHFGPSRSFPNLKFVTITLFDNNEPSLLSESHNVLANSYSERLEAITLTLRIHVMLSMMGWMESEVELLAQPYKKISAVEIKSPLLSGFLEMEHIRSNLPNWLSRFPNLTVVDIVGYNTMDGGKEESHKELFETIKQKNGEIEGMYVNSIRVI
ncbi:hypothetical protein AX16_004494 [Volvariella volvacea WC 439]|nr:hypothetical protein AX16_004494 [Volvariella volvacea WC 439]